MVSLIFVWMFFIYGVNSQVVFTVFPEIVEPGNTPSFTLLCSVVDIEIGEVQSITIFRRAVTARQAKVSPKEVITELIGPAPGKLTVSPNFANVTARGQIVTLQNPLQIQQIPPQQFPQTPQGALQAIQQEILVARQLELAALQADLSAYLDVTFPDPTVEDLGVYTCEATIIGIGSGQTLFSEVKVTTSNLLTDRLLVAVSEIQSQNDVFNRTLLSVQSHIDNITAAIDGVAATEATVTETTQAVIYAHAENATFTTVETTPVQDKITSSDLNKLTRVLESLDGKFQKFNKTLQRLNNIVDRLEQRVEQTAANATIDVPVASDEARHYFTIGNASFILFKSSVNGSSNRSQAVCESKRLVLAEIHNAEDFQIISNETAPFVSNESLILVSGQRKLGQSEWVFHNSQQLVNFDAWTTLVEQREPINDECLALKHSQKDSSLASVPCAAEYENAFYLCQRGSNIA